MKLRKKIAMFLAVIMSFLAVVPVSIPKTVLAAEKRIKPIVLKPGKMKEVQLDGKGKKEKLLYTFTREKLREEEYSTYYKMKYRFSIDDNVIIDKSWVWVFSNWNDENGSEWKEVLKRNGEIIVTDIDKADGRKDIFVSLSATDYEDEYLEKESGDLKEIMEEYRIQYADGRVQVKENLEETIRSWKLPKIVEDRWDFEMSLAGDDDISCAMEPYYQNGEWKYKKKKSVPKIYQLTTTGDGTAKWAVCLGVYKIGYIHGTITLKLKNNKLQLKSKSLSGDILDTGCSGAVDKEMTVYKTAGGKKPAFTVPAKTSVSFVSYRIVNNKVYIKVKNSKGKIGWISEKEMKCLYFDGTLHA